jgi:Outer membrane protein beta-barrel domain
MRKGKVLGLVAALAITSLPAVAADNGVYIGGSVGLAGVDIGELDYNANATGFKVIAGWRFLDWLSVEGGYVDFGSGDDDVLGETLEVDASGLTVSAVGFLPIGPVDLFGKVGVIDWDADLSDGINSFGADGTDLAYGGGVQFRLGSLALRAEYEVFDFDGVDVDLLSAGFTWTFF